MAEEPAGTATPRSYRILALFAESAADYGWIDFGWSPGSTQEAAIERAEEKHARLKSAAIQVAIPEAHFRPQRMKTEVVRTVKRSPIAEEELSRALKGEPLDDDGKEGSNGNTTE